METIAIKKQKAEPNKEVLNISGSEALLKGFWPRALIPSSVIPEVRSCLHLHAL
jgi:hypothetical protein